MGLLRCALFGAFVSACTVVPNPEYGQDGDAPTGDETGTVGTAASTTADDSAMTSGPRADAGSSDTAEPEPPPATTDDDSTGDAPLGCSEAPPAHDGPCPPACDSCDGDTCRIACEGDQACKDAEVACPPGRPCLVQCIGKQACQAASIVCSPAHACHVACAGEQSCIDLVLHCGGGTCDLECDAGKDACKATRVRCGPATGFVSCASAQEDLELEPFPGSACPCEIDDGCRNRGG